MNIKINIKGFIIALLILGWTFYCVDKMESSLKSDLCASALSSNLCSTWNDLTTNLIYMIFELSVFILILNPLYLDLKKSLIRFLLLLLLLTPLGVLHTLRTWHAGIVNGIMGIWWLGMVSIVMVLIIIGLIYRWKFNGNR